MDWTLSSRTHEVRAEDILGGVHCFRTDDRRRAEEVAELLREEIGSVEMSEHAPQKHAAALP